MGKQKKTQTGGRLKLKKQTVKDLADRKKDVKGGGYNSQFCGAVEGGSRSL